MQQSVLATNILKNIVAIEHLLAPPGSPSQSNEAATDTTGDLSLYLGGIEALLERNTDDKVSLVQSARGSLTALDSLDLTDPGQTTRMSC